MSVSSSLASAEAALSGSCSGSPKLDASVLLSTVLRCERFELHVQRGRQLSAEEEKRFNDFITRRKAGEPVAYITGEKEFWSMKVCVTKDVLVPRPETELVVEEALRIGAKVEGSIDVLDICTGSGNIAMALSKELPSARITISDVSGAALGVAVSNLGGCSERVTVLHGNLFDPIPENSSYDIITCNPPYVRDGDREKLQPEIREYEPGVALFAGEDGLDVIRKILKNAPRFLKPSGAVVMEIGFGQTDDVISLAAKSGFGRTKAAKDLSGIDRVVVLWKNS